MIDIIGPIFSPPAQPGGQWKRLWGFHVIATHDLIAARPHLQTSVYHPTAMHRVWSGDNPDAPAQTVALRFSGEAAAREALADLWPDPHAPNSAPTASTPD